MKRKKQIGNSLKDMNISTKILIYLSFILLLGYAITGFFVISNAKKNFTVEIGNQLMTQVTAIRDFIVSTDTTTEEVSKYIEDNALFELSERALSLKNNLSKLYSLYVSSGKSPSVIKAQLAAELLQISIGEEGYAYALDQEGTLVVHPSNQGTNLKGKAHIDKILEERNGATVYERVTDKSRPKVVAAYRYFPEMEWIIVLTVPYEELIQVSNKVKKEMLSDIQSIIKRLRAGKSGYYYLMSSNGELLVHPDSEGKNILSNDFAKEMIKNKSGIIRYKWNGKYKIVAYTYYPARDWIIAGGSYEDEFIGPIIKGTILNFLFVSAVMMVVLVVVLRFVFKVNVISPIIELEGLFNRVARGDLSDKLTVKKRDEIGRIVVHVNDMIDQMNNALCEVNSSTNDVSNTAEALATSSSQMSAGAESQAEKITSVEVAMQEMTATITEISKNLEEVNNEIEEIKHATEKGSKVVDETVEGINNLSDTVISSAGKIKELGKSSEQIGEILQVISEIADQTNLLALNAAIEAARAGEHGRGFAVVADEVRKLAERTVKATGEIDSMIKSIQAEVKSSVVEMDKGAELARKGGILVDNLKSNLSVIIDGILDVADKITAVVSAVEQQSATSQEISNNMAEISAIAQENASISQENHNQAEILKELANRLKNIVNNFTLNECH